MTEQYMYAAYDAQTDDLIGIGTADELSVLTGRKKESIYSSVTRAKRLGHLPTAGIAFVRIEDEEDE